MIDNNFYITFFIKNLTVLPLWGTVDTYIVWGALMNTYTYAFGYLPNMFSAYTSNTSKNYLCSRWT